MVKRTALFVLMMTLLLFNACAGGDGKEERFLSFREEAAAGAITAAAEVCADYGGTVYDFTLRCSGADGAYEVEVLSPENIAGIRARISGEGSELEFDGLILDTGDLTADGLTPVSALPTVLAAAAEGHVERLWEADGFLAAEIYLSDTDTLTLWLDSADRPSAAEIVSGGALVLSCRFTDWQAKR